MRLGHLVSQNVLGRVKWWESQCFAHCCWIKMQCTEHTAGAWVVWDAGSGKHSPWACFGQLLKVIGEGAELALPSGWVRVWSQLGDLSPPLLAQNEIFASRHQDENSVACIEEKCYVLTFAEYCR